MHACLAKAYDTVGRAESLKALVHSNCEAMRNTTGGSKGNGTARSAQSAYE